MTIGYSNSATGSAQRSKACEGVGVGAGARVCVWGVFINLIPARKKSLRGRANTDCSLKHMEFPRTLYVALFSSTSSVCLVNMARLRCASRRRRRVARKSPAATPKWRLGASVPRALLSLPGRASSVALLGNFVSRILCFFLTFSGILFHLVCIILAIPLTFLPFGFHSFW